MRIRRKIIILFSLMSVLSLNGFSQAAHQKSTDKEYEKHPRWIAMMSDTAANYFEAVKAFDLFWKGRVKPIEEEDVIGQEHGHKLERKNFIEKLFRSRKEKQEAEAERYAFQYKKFKNWQRATLPYVQPDGRILTPTERLQIWEQQKSSK